MLGAAREWTSGEWLTGGDALFDVLHRDVPCARRTRPMYDNVVDVPRLTKFYDIDEPLPIRCSSPFARR